MNEPCLRVIQALEIKEHFEYWLMRKDITYLRNKGYTVTIKSRCLKVFFCVILPPVISKKGTVMKLTKKQKEILMCLYEGKELPRMNDSRVLNNLEEMKLITFGIARYRLTEFGKDIVREQLAAH